MLFSCFSQHFNSTIQHMSTKKSSSTWATNRSKIHQLPLALPGIDLVAQDIGPRAPGDLCGHVQILRAQHLGRG